MDVKVVQGNKRYGDAVVARSTKVTMQGCNKRDAEAMKGGNKKVRDYVSKNMMRMDTVDAECDDSDAWKT